MRPDETRPGACGGAHTPGVVRLYERLGVRNNLGESSLYLNLGDWDGESTYDGACAALARTLGRAAGLAPGQRVLDAGFGFGEQDRLWCREFSPARIDGVNPTPSQVRAARARVLEEGLRDRVDLRLGDATALRFPDRTFDRVLALESAFHFAPREAFFEEAHRVLVPGGRIALADLCLRGDAPRSWLERATFELGARFWNFPVRNAYGVVGYAKRLEAAGFRNVACRSVRDRVFEPFCRYARARLRDPEIAARFDPWIRLFYRASVWSARAWDRLDYLIVTADREPPDRDRADRDPRGAGTSRTV